MTRNGRTGVSSRRKRAPAADLDCVAAFRKIAHGCVAGVRAHHASASAGDAEAVHQIRVEMTRLRAAVSFFRPIVVDAEWPGLKKEIAWLNTTLGDARDDDVMTQYASRARYRAWAERMIGGHFDQCRVRDRRQLVRCLRSVRFQRLIAALSGWIRHRPRQATEPLKTYCERELDRWRRRLIRKGRHIEALDASRRHRLRIKAKRFRYMLEVLAATGALRDRGELRRLRGSARRMQRALGDLRDLKRFAGLAVPSAPAGGGKRGKRRPPGYRRRKERLRRAAVEAYRSFKQARVC